MNVAIFLFGTRISPRFDCAPRILLITIDETIIIGRKEMRVKSDNYIEIINQLKAAAVDVVICGGISKDMLEMLKANETEVIPWVCGDAKKALRLFLDGKLFPGAIVCPGRQIRQWGFCKNRHKEEQ